MKDKNLRKALGIHGFEDNLCGCDMIKVKDYWSGELPELWNRIEKLEKEVYELKTT